MTKSVTKETVQSTLAAILLPKVLPEKINRFTKVQGAFAKLRPLW